jgi:hypothetical protein
MNRVHYSSQSVDWATPKGIFDALDAEFHFDNDPNPLGSIELVGLVPWGKRNFVNPPYGRGLYRWIELGWRNDNIRDLFTNNIVKDGQKYLIVDVAR